MGVVAWEIVGFWGAMPGEDGCAQHRQPWEAAIYSMETDKRSLEVRYYFRRTPGLEVGNHKLDSLASCCSSLPHGGGIWEGVSWEGEPLTECQTTNDYASGIQYPPWLLH